MPTANPLTVEQAREEAIATCIDYAHDGPDGPKAYLHHVEGAIDALISSIRTEERRGIAAEAYQEGYGAGVAFVRAAQTAISQVGVWQKCPVCDGQGKVSRPSWIAGDQQTWTDSSTGPHPCRRCAGTGTIAMGYASPVPAPQPPSEPERFTADDLRKMGEYKEGGYVAYSRDALRHVADLLDHPMRVRVSAAPPVVAREEDLANPITFEKWMDSGCPGQNSARHPPPAPPRPSAEAVAWLRHVASGSIPLNGMVLSARDLLRFVEGRTNAR